LDRNCDETRCIANLTNIDQQPLRVGNAILFDLVAQGLDPLTPIYAESRANFSNATS
jgi:hypothetical protein